MRLHLMMAVSFETHEVDQQNREVVKLNLVKSLAALDTSSMREPMSSMSHTLSNKI
jgi:hypothetical protein